MDIICTLIYGIKKDDMPVESYLNYIEHEKRYSPHTLLAYRTDLLQYITYLADTLEIAPADAKATHIRSYLVSLVENQASPGSVGRKLSVIKSYYKFLLRRREVVMNPANLLRAPKMPSRLPVFIPDAQMNSLLDSEDIFALDFGGIRDKAIIELLFGTGIRLSELLGLREDDLDFYTETIRVTGKRSKVRIVPMTRQLILQVKLYLTEKSLQKFNNKCTALFVTDKGKPAYPMFVYLLVKRYLTYISTQDKKSPHVLRHSYATSLLNGGADLNAIKELLGHASLAATQVYTHNSIARLKSIYKQAHPKA